MSQTRRPAAILAADVAGYSRLMGADEEGTHERLKALRHELVDPKIADHHGRIVKSTGDGLLAEFPSVVDAVRRAVAVQQATAERDIGAGAGSRIELRIGINLGDVIVEGGNPLRRRRQRRRADRSPGRCRRGVRLQFGVRSGARPAAFRLRRSGRAAGQKHCAGAGPRDQRQCGFSDALSAAAPRPDRAGPPLLASAGQTSTICCPPSAAQPPGGGRRHTRCRARTTLRYR
jgi:hypothetical protein